MLARVSSRCLFATETMVRMPKALPYPVANAYVRTFAQVPADQKKAADKKAADKKPVDKKPVDKKPAQKRVLYKVGDKKISSSKLEKHVAYKILRGAVLPKKLYSQSGVLAADFYAKVFLQAVNAKYDLTRINESDAHRVGVDAVSQTSQSLATFQQTLTDYPRLRKFLENPGNSVEKKQKLFHGLRDKLKMNTFASDFIDTLIANKSFRRFFKVNAEVQKLIRAAENVVNVTVTIAPGNTPPKAETILKILDLDKNANINMKTVLDESIGGGAIFKTDDKVADFSHAHKIRTLRNKCDEKLKRLLDQQRASFVKQLQHYEKAVEDQVVARSKLADSEWAEHIRAVIRNQQAASKAAPVRAATA